MNGYFLSFLLLTFFTCPSVCCYPQICFGFDFPGFYLSICVCITPPPCFFFFSPSAEGGWGMIKPALNLHGPWPDFSQLQKHLEPLKYYSIHLKKKKKKGEKKQTWGVGGWWGWWGRMERWSGTKQKESESSILPKDLWLIDVKYPLQCTFECCLTHVASSVLLSMCIAREDGGPL